MMFYVGDSFNGKRIFKFLDIKVLMLLMFVCLVNLSLNYVVNAATIDDVRELAGKGRLDESFSAAEQRRIELEYKKVESYNRVVAMLGSDDVFSDVVKQRLKLDMEIEKQRQELIKVFTTGGSVHEVLSEKVKLDNLRYEKEKLRPYVLDDIDMNPVPNVWKSKYEKAMSISKEITSYKDIGEIGVDMKSPVRGHFYITSPFGLRVHPVTYELRMHNGLDLWGKTGTDVLAAWNGEVVGVYETERGGKTIEIEHDKGLRTRYLHLSEILVKKGQKVKQYDLIGKVGATGVVTGPHLHFEVILDGEPVNPIFFFGSNGVKAMQEYLSNYSDNDYLELKSLLAQVKDRPKNMENKKKEVEKIKREIFRKTGDVPKGSKKIVVEKGYYLPSPADVVD